MQHHNMRQYQVQLCKVEEERERDRAHNKLKEMNREWSKHENVKAKESELQSADKLEEEMDNLKVCEANAMGLLSDCNKRIRELEAELEKRKESEGNLYGSLVMQTEQLEQNKVVLEDSKLEIASLHEKVKALQAASTCNNMAPQESQNGLEGGLHNKDNGTQLDNKKPVDAQKGEKLAPMTEETLLEEIRSLKYELKLATEAEENSSKAMEDLALALKEVATEANQAKEKQTVTEEQLEQTKKESERLKMLLESTQDKYKELLDEADRYKNTAERLRLEAEESLSAWNEKETEFVNCIRKADEERLAAKKEATRLLEKIRVAENRTLVAKEENQKLRDILKQALNEANVAKEAAGIAQAENSQLKDSLASREGALNLLAQENEILKIHEAAAFENIKELKRLLLESSAKESKNEDKEKSSTKVDSAPEQKEHKNDKNLSKTFSLNLKDIIIPNRQRKEENGEASDETDDTLKGSIFDESTCTPDSVSHHHDGEILGGSIDFDHLDDEMGNSRKRRALLRRFGDLIRRRGYHRKEPSME